MSTSNPSCGHAGAEQSKAPSLATRRLSNAIDSVGPANALDVEATVVPGRPSEQLQTEERNISDDDAQYPTGPQVWLNLVAILIVTFLHGLDLTIVAVAIPSLTNQFKTIADIGWYSAIYGLISSAMIFFFSKLYTLFDLRRMLVVSMLLFELGSVICTFAPASKVFILGRAVAALGAAGLGAGQMVFIPRFFPNHKRPIINGCVGFAQSIGLVTAPVIGGALTDAFTWRACFGINVPLGLAAAAIIAYGVKDPNPSEDLALPSREKLKRIDPIGTLLVVPSVVCLMLALQWGGTKFGWGDWRIIMLLVLFAALAIAFGYVQFRQQDKAILPPQILKNRSVLAGTLFACCCNGILAVTEYYISIYFQGVRGYTATRSGVLGLPMIAGISVGAIAGAFGTTFIGYYTREYFQTSVRTILTTTAFMFATSILAPIASGLITTVDLDDAPGKVAALLGFLGVAVGIGLQSPFTATMTIISSKEVAIALGVVAFGAGIGSSLSIAASATLFTERLTAEIAQYAPGVNSTLLHDHGLSDLRSSLGSDRLKEVLFGYNEAVVQTLYFPLALGLLTLVASAFMEIKSVKKKTD